MKRRVALVTGAGGFLGRYVVRALHNVSCRVKAGIHHERDRRHFTGMHDVEPVKIDILSPDSLGPAMEGVDHLYHCAALVDSRAPSERLLQVNTEGTRRVWECAAASGVQRALCCSSAAVYGLLAGNRECIVEHVKARAVEPYGYSKRRGEAAALDVASRTGLHTTIIRPVAIFGPGEHTPFGKNLRTAAFSRLLIAGGFQEKRFSFVHVEDVAGAALHLMHCDHPSGEIYNVAVAEPILYEDAFSAYRKILRDAGRSYTVPRLLAAVSRLLLDHEGMLRRLSKAMSDRFLFSIWHPGFDLTYSSAKLRGTSFTFHWETFEKVFASCIE